MSRKGATITALCSVLALILSLAAMVSVGGKGNISKQNQQEEQGDIQYVMYLGTNDQDTNEPVFSSEEAKAKAEEILIEHFGGYTIQEANGGWVDGGTVYREYTLVIYISDTDLDHVHQAAKDMIEVFNQSSVLIQSNKTTTEFYDGSN